MSLGKKQAAKDKETEERNAASKLISSRIHSRQEMNNQETAVILTGYQT